MKVLKKVLIFNILPCLGLSVLSWLLFSSISVIYNLESGGKFALSIQWIFFLFTHAVYQLIFAAATSYFKLYRKPYYLLFFTLIIPTAFLIIYFLLCNPPQFIYEGILQARSCWKYSGSAYDLCLDGAF